MPDQHTTRTKREAARHFGVSTRTIERRLAAGQLASTIVHGPHGPEVRVVLPATGADGAAPDAPPSGDGGGAGAGGLVAAVTRVAAPPAAPPPPDLALLLAALAEANRERQALAYRLGQAEAELARVQRTRWYTAAPQRALQALRRALRREGGDHA